MSRCQFLDNQYMIYANSPRYLAESVTTCAPYRSLRSTDQALLVVPRINPEHKLFHAQDPPSLWKSLPLHLRTQCDSGIFRKHVNTFLFKQVFYSIVYIILCIVLLSQCVLLICLVQRSYIYCCNVAFTFITYFHFCM